MREWMRMVALMGWLAADGWLCAQGTATFRVEGRVTPPAVASVSLHGATTPFAVATLSHANGRFRFPRIQAGTYTLNVFVPGRGEVRRTLVVSAGHADERGRMVVTVAMSDAIVDRDAATTVSVRALATPERARREYKEAQKKLQRRDVAGAEGHLRKAVELAPHYADAWNYLGTIAYQTQRYPEAEQLFRRALEADAALYAPLVNLGGSADQPDAV